MGDSISFQKRDIGLKSTHDDEGNKKRKDDILHQPKKFKKQ